MKNQIMLALLCTVTMRGTTTATHNDTECSNYISGQMQCKETHHTVYVNQGDNLILNCTCFNEYNGQWIGPNTIGALNAAFIPYTQGLVLNKKINQLKYRLVGGYDTHKCNLQIMNFLSDDNGQYKCQYMNSSTIYINVFNIRATHKSTMHMKPGFLHGTGYLRDTSTKVYVGQRMKTEIFTFETKHMDQGEFLTIWWTLPLILIIITVVAVIVVLLRRRIAKMEQNQRIEDIGDDFQGNLVENNVYQMSSFLELHNEQEHDEAVSFSQMHADTGDRHSNVRKTSQVSGHHSKRVLSQGAHAQINEFNMNYADVIFDVKSSTRHIVIHGNDERTIYSEIDHAMNAEPLPSSSSESEED